MSEIRGLAENSEEKEFQADSFTIDLLGVETKAELHQLLASVLKFPEYYGNNLDALVDILCDEHPLWDITFTSCQQAADHLGSEYFESFKQTFTDAAEENSLVKVQFL